MVDLARENRAQTAASQQNLLAESYYGLRLAQQVIAVREETYKGLQKHYENALKLEAAGMIDKAGRLFAQVNMDEAKRALEAARKEETVVQSALKVLLNKKDTDENIVPTSPLFMNDSLPPKMLLICRSTVETICLINCSCKNISPNRKYGLPKVDTCRI